MSEIPIGLCQCGCGQRTSLARSTETAKGIVKGQPRRFIIGHQSRGVIKATPEERFWSKVDKTKDCWNWTAFAGRDGYGRLYLEPKTFVPAHRFAYELLVGPIPDGLVLDHLCRNRACCNPGHLEPVTHRENCRRGARGRMVTHCAQGHEYTPENTHIKPNGCRTCRACSAASSRRRRAALRDQRAAV